MIVPRERLDESRAKVDKKETNIMRYTTRSLLLLCQMTVQYPHPIWVFHESGTFVMGSE